MECAALEEQLVTCTASELYTLSLPRAQQGDQYVSTNYISCFEMKANLVWSQKGLPPDSETSAGTIDSKSSSHVSGNSDGSHVDSYAAA